MKIEIEHYIEIFYNYNPDCMTKEDSIDRYKIYERNPLLFEEKCTGTRGFRFYDQIIFQNGDKKICKKVNYSNMFYCGIYLNSSEIEDMCSWMPKLNKEIKIVNCGDGGIVTDVMDGDMTIEEYKNGLGIKENTLVYNDKNAIN